MKRGTLKFDLLSVYMSVQVTLLGESLAAKRAYAWPVRYDISALIFSVPPMPRRRGFERAHLS